MRIAVLTAPSKEDDTFLTQSLHSMIKHNEDDVKTGQVKCLVFLFG